MKFGQKLKFSSKIEILDQRTEFGRKLRFSSELKTLARNQDFRDN